MGNIADRFVYGAKIVLYILAALLPIFFIPFPIGMEVGREIVFSALVVLGVILWLLSILKTGEIRFQFSPILYAALLLLVVFAFGTIFSRAPYYSAFLADPIAEKFSTFLLGLAIMILAGGVFKSREEVRRWTFILLFSGAVAGLLNILQMTQIWPIYKSIASFASGADFNVIGTVNGLALFYGMLLVVGLGLLFSSSLLTWKPWLRYGLFVSLAVFLADLLIINFRTSWIIFLGVIILLFGFKIRDVRQVRKLSGPEGNPVTPDEVNGIKKRGLDWQYVLTIFLLAFSVVMILVRTPLVQVNLPAEVSPTLTTTFGIVKGVFKEGPKVLLLGSGSGTFGLEWSLYKNQSINQTIFWGVRFNQGFSWLATLLVTGGVLGFLTLLAFLGVCLFLFLKSLLPEPEGEVTLGMALFLGFAFLVLSAFLYPANSTMIWLIFFCVGFLSLILAKEVPVAEEAREVSAAEGVQEIPGVEAVNEVLEAEGAKIAPAAEEVKETPSAQGVMGFKFAFQKGKFWEIKNLLIKFESPWAVFLSSLAVVLLLSLGVASLYFELGNVKAVFAGQAGINALNQGTIDLAIDKFKYAANLQDSNFRYFHALAQARIEKIKGLIQRASTGENVQEEFRSTVVLAIQNMQKAIELYPVEPVLWRTQGALYELLIPFIPGSEKPSFDSYQKATEYEPTNPAAWVDLGRAYLVLADRLQFAANQASVSDRPQIQQNREMALKGAEGVLQKATEVKADFAPAHFLLAQTQIRLGNIQSAIASTEKAKLAAPFEVGIAFQLGLLYYQSNDFDRAQVELERAVSLSQNYSNARYFLGLTYDHRGDKERAIKQFEQIEVFNPDNQEVKRILENLHAGKGALEKIVPPAEPPEKRKETPVKEGGEKEGPRIQLKPKGR